MTDTLHRDDMTDILPGFQQMLRAMAEPDGVLTCDNRRTPFGVMDMEKKGLIRVSKVTAETVVFVLTDEGRAYVDQLG